MEKTKEEQDLLAKLASDTLDGMVGDERVYRGYKNVYCGKYIKDGEPVSYREAESERFFNGKENEKIPGERIEECYDTGEKKLDFLYLMDHISARSADIAELFGIKGTRAKKPLSELIADGIVVAEGGNRNRTYKLKS